MNQIESFKISVIIEKKQYKHYEIYPLKSENQ